LQWRHWGSLIFFLFPLAYLQFFFRNIDASTKEKPADCPYYRQSTGTQINGH
jgi:hypothetical protein